MLFACLRACFDGPGDEQKLVACLLACRLFSCLLAFLLACVLACLLARCALASKTPAISKNCLLVCWLAFFLARLRPCLLCVRPICSMLACFEDPGDKRIVADRLQSFVRRSFVLSCVVSFRACGRAFKCSLRPGNTRHASRFCSTPG